VTAPERESLTRTLGTFGLELAEGLAREVRGRVHVHILEPRPRFVAWVWDDGSVYFGLGGKA
jgi:hypothetical protein